MEKEYFYDLLRSVPKAELHVHQEAVLRRDTIKKVFAKNFGRKMSNDEMDELFSYTDLPGFLTSFLKIQSYFREMLDFTPMLEDFAAYLEENNIVYTEAFFSPTSHMKKGWDFNEMMDIVEDSLRQIKEEKGRTVRLLVDVSRSFGEENAMRNLDYVIERKSPWILGIGLGGDEVKGPAKDYARVFDKAFESGLHVVAHAGETSESWSMKDSIKLLHAERLGHGIAAADDEEFMAELKETQIPLEVCPTSNIFLLQKFNGDMARHPVRRLYDAGCFVTISTDDPTFFKVSLIDEYWNLYSSLNFTLDEIRSLVKNGFKAAFLSAEEKEEYCHRVDEAWNSWAESNKEKF